jgi:hypothetical protein
MYLQLSLNFEGQIKVMISKIAERKADFSCICYISLATAQCPYSRYPNETLKPRVTRASIPCIPIQSSQFENKKPILTHILPNLLPHLIIGATLL